MNLSALETFLAVVETGNLNKAAERLNVTQSAVTTRLDTLEMTLGQTLLIRSRRGAQLTREGFQFQRHAELIMQAWGQAQNAVGLPKGFSGLFSFACQFDLWDSSGRAWLEALRGQYGDVAMEAWPGDLSDIKLWLSSGITDAALLVEPVAGPGLKTREVAEERLVQVASVARKVQRWDPDYVYVDLGPEFRRQHSVAWPGDETAAMTYGSSRWALDHLLAHGGSAYLPWSMVSPLVDDGQLFAVEGSPEFSRGLHLVWREASASRYPWIAGSAVSSDNSLG